MNASSPPTPSGPSRPPAAVPTIAPAGTASPGGVDCPRLTFGRLHDERRSAKRSALVDHEVDGVVRGSVAVVAELDRVAGRVEGHASHRQNWLRAADLEVPAFQRRRHPGTDALLSDNGPYATLA